MSRTDLKGTPAHWRALHPSRRQLRRPMGAASRASTAQAFFTCPIPRVRRLRLLAEKRGTATLTNFSNLKVGGGSFRRVPTALGPRRAVLASPRAGVSFSGGNRRGSGENDLKTTATTKVLQKLKKRFETMLKLWRIDRSPDSLAGSTGREAVAIVRQSPVPR